MSDFVIYRVSLAIFLFNTSYLGSIESSNTFCTVIKPCLVNQGDCNSNDQCNGSLVCGINNCASSQFNGTYDCCMAATEGMKA